MPHPELYAITDRRLMGDDPVARLERAFVAGLRWVQVREKDLSPRALAALVARIVEAARPLAARVMVNDRADVAAATGADGVHLTETSMAIADVRRAFPGLIVGASCHGREAALSAAGGGVDFIVFGPVFATPSKLRYGPPLGLEALAEVAGSVSVPVVAVGGIEPAQVAACRTAGAAGVAAIRGLVAGPAIDIAVAAYAAALEASRRQLRRP